MASFNEPMASYKERMASLRRRIASDAARPEAAPPDPRRKVAVQQMAASFQSRMASHRHRVAVPDPALAPARSLAEQTLLRQEQLKALRNQNRDLESQLHQALSVKSHKESEYKRITESISNATATNEKLRDSLIELRNKGDACAAVISEQFQDLETREAKANEDATLRENLEAATSWFSKFLGWQVIVGEEGVKFVFDKIDPQRPEKEYSFCIKIDNNTYNSVVRCDPPIKDFDELLKDLNLSGDLYKFVKVSREKFQAFSVNGNLPLSSGTCPDVPSVPFSPPVMMTVNRMSEDVPSQSNSRSKNKRLPAKRRGTAPSPGSTRRSPRLQGLGQREN